MEVGELPDSNFGCWNPKFLSDVMLALGVKALGLPGISHGEGHILEVTCVLPLAGVELSVWNLRAVAEGIHKLTRKCCGKENQHRACACRN